MKIEEKHLVLGEKIGKIAILAGLFLWFLQATFNAGALAIITFIFAMITLAAFIIKMFWNKYASILNMIIFLGGLLYLFFVALGFIILNVSLAGSITLLILSILLLAGLVTEIVLKKNLDDYQKYLNGFMVFIYGFSNVFVLAGISNFGLGIAAIVIIALGVVLFCAATYFKMRGVSRGSPSE